MNDDQERLIARYLDGTASQGEVDRLDGLLRRDPEARRALYLAAEQGDTLRELLGESRNAALARSASTSGAGRSWLVAAAAALAVAFVGAVILGLSSDRPAPVASTPELVKKPAVEPSPAPAPPRVAPEPPIPADAPTPAPVPAPRDPAPAEPTPAPSPVPPSPAPAPASSGVRETVAVVGVVERLAGDVRIVAGDQVIPVALHQKLLAGQAVETVGRGRAMLNLEPGVSVELGTDTIVAQVAGPDLMLERGTLRADLPAGKVRPVVVSTGRARAEVGGTKFHVRSGPDGTWMEIDRGRARMQRKEDGASIEIGAGQFGAVIPGLPFAPRGQETAVDQVKVDAAITRGVEFLRTAPLQGGAAKKDSDELILLTLLHAGVTESDPLFKRLLTAMLQDPLERTYNVSLQAMVLEELDRVEYQARLQQCAQFLIDNQCKNGQWSYGTPSMFVDALPVPTDAPKPVTTGGGARDFSAPKEKPKVVRRLPVKKMRNGPATGDNSNSQYAALGLRACHDGGIDLPRTVVQAAKDWWIKSQGPDEAPNSGYEGVRGWAYAKADGKDDDDLHNDVLGSMTAGAVGGLVICDYLLGLDWKKNLQVRAGLNWLASHFMVNDNPGGKPWRQYYFLYGMERAGVLSGTEKFGAHAWYPLGARYLIDAQQPNGAWRLQNQTRTNPVWDTCFAILFLKRATKPLVVSEDRKMRK